MGMTLGFWYKELQHRRPRSALRVLPSHGPSTVAKLQTLLEFQRFLLRISFPAPGWMPHTSRRGWQ